MAQVNVRLAIPSDIEDVLPLCSGLELQTLSELYNDSPENLLRLAVYSAQRPYAGLIDGKVVCLFGAHSPSLLSEEIYIWLLGSRALRQYPILFIKHCKPIFEYLTKDKSVVKTRIDTRNPRAVRLAKMFKLMVVKSQGFVNEVELRKN